MTDEGPPILEDGSLQEVDLQEQTPDSRKELSCEDVGCDCADRDKTRLELLEFQTGVVQAVKSWNLPFNLGLVVLHVAQCGKKPGADPRDDLARAKLYIEDAIKDLEDAERTMEEKAAQVRLVDMATELVEANSSGSFGEAHNEELFAQMHGAELKDPAKKY